MRYTVYRRGEIKHGINVVLQMTPPLMPLHRSCPQGRLCAEEHLLALSTVDVFQRCWTPSGLECANQSHWKHKQPAVDRTRERCGALVPRPSELRAIVLSFRTRKSIVSITFIQVLRQKMNPSTLYETLSLYCSKAKYSDGKHLRECKVLIQLVYKLWKPIRIWL
ncbi:hypothetical protein F2P81_018513 [Scophthalmus maximus]|uniref:Uncharacterized protein n=1 Tax=Scophthalmus maximus TaxID=52904 RepID=A0A6A4SAV8_SCOMX|nr:hypothetical protein F2P81_018513 [Scophthalmus maximus]